MPFARLTVAAPELPADTQAALAAGITALLEQDLLKEPEVTVAHVNLVPSDRWFVGGVRTPGTTGVHLEVSITAGTNTAAERAAFIAHAHDLLSTTLGPLPPAAYVAIYELDAESYGYHGITQLARRRIDPAERD